MSSSRSAGTSPRRARSDVERVRRRRALLGAMFVLLLAAAAVARTGGPAENRDRIDGRAGPAHLSVSSVGWPAQGQAALVVGDDRPAASPHQQPVPIASLAKVMTAYLTLEHDPLTRGQDGFTITITPAEAEAEVRDAADDQSVAAVAAGEQLTERQLLEALLIPSGNNIAEILAERTTGGEPRFVAEMNAEARALGMNHTSYTDPSGWDPKTVSTAADQLRILRRAMRFTVFRQIVSMPDVTLPVAGTLTNTNPLIADGYAGKTGSDTSAGGCLAFFTPVTVGGRRVTAAGVVLGQGDGSDTAVILGAAGQAARQLVDSVALARGAASIAAPGETGRRPRVAGSPDGRPSSALRAGRRGDQHHPPPPP